jgi:hypothetical protein
VIDRLPRATWRLVVATVALAGFGLASGALDTPFQELGTLACLATGLIYLALAVAGLVSPAVSWAWARGAVATVLLLVGVTHLFFVDGGAAPGWPLLERVVTPLLVVLDVALLPGARGAWWWPVTWVLLPVAYFGYHRFAELTVYDALDPYATDYGATLAGLLALAVALAFLVFSLVRLRQSAYDRDIS